MPKKGKKKGQKPTRKSNRQATKKKTAQSVRNNYKKTHKGLNRQRRKPTVFTPCENTNTYNRAWPPNTVGGTTTAISISLGLGQGTKNYVETLGEKGAKWYLANQLLGKTIEDGTAPFKNGYFYTFSGAHTFDIVYVDAGNNHVYVIEAKGTQQGAAANLITRQNGKTQGNWNYLDEVANEMNNNADALKQAAAQKIINAPPGKLHYIGVHTTYSVGGNNSVTANVPTQIFSKNR